MAGRKSSGFAAGVLDKVLRHPLVPRPDNFTPSVRTPWGGTLIREMKKLEGEEIIGESWEISGHPRFPNRYSSGIVNGAVEIPFSALSEHDAEAFFGAENVRCFGPNMPFLTKLLNSGSWSKFKLDIRCLLDEIEEYEDVENVMRWNAVLDIPQGKLISHITNRNHHKLHMALLRLEGLLKNKGQYYKALYNIHSAMLSRNLSVQIHPPKGYRTDAPSKTEAWYIISAEDGAGIYLGLKDGVTEMEMRARLESGEDITPLLNFVEVKKGDAFYIPAGIPHAIGAGILLYEPQESSEETFRYYDWAGRGRKDEREIHVADALAVTIWDGLRGDALVRSLRRRQRRITNGGGAEEDLFVATPEFRFSRISFRQGETYEGVSGFQGLTVIKGGIDLYSEDSSIYYGCFIEGRSVVIPAAMGGYKLVSRKSSGETVVLRTSNGEK